MLRVSSSICPFCEVRAIIQSSKQTSLQPWRQVRTITRMKERPTRMTLSKQVAQSTPKKPARRKEDGPFRGMNMTEVRMPRSAPQPSAAEVKRTSRGREQPKEKREPYKALKMQRALSEVNYNKRTAIKTKIASTEDFDQFKLLPIVQQAIGTQALPGLDHMAPTPIQRLAIPELLTVPKKKKKVAADQDDDQYDQYLLAAETGSGKTLAYLLPIVDAIKRAELKDKAMEEKRKSTEVEKQKQNLFELESPPLSSEPHPDAARPRAIILVPTSELVAQVGAVAKSLSHIVKFKAAMISAAFSGKVIRNRLFSTNGIDLLISTPHLLESISQSDPHILSRVTHLVVDEADSLLDRSFAPLTTTIVDKSAPSLQKLILCSATIPRSLDSYLRKRYPDIQRLTTPNLHAIPRRVQLGVVDVDKEPYRGNKNLACADTIWSIGRSNDEFTPDDRDKAPIKRVIVFVNEREQASELAEYLRSKGIDASALSRDIEESRSEEFLKDFTGQPAAADAKKADESKKSTEQKPVAAPRRQLTNTKVIVMTDLGARGIDTTAVRHVILYDVPHTTIDFIHRLGRTGRMGRRGRGIVLVGKGDRKDVVKEVREGMFKGMALI